MQQASTEPEFTGGFIMHQLLRFCNSALLIGRANLCLDNVIKKLNLRRCNILWLLITRMCIHYFVICFLIGVGVCSRCQNIIKRSEDGCTAMDRFYHSACFTCESCSEFASSFKACLCLISMNLWVIWWSSRWASGRERMSKWVSRRLSEWINE